MYTGKKYPYNKGYTGVAALFAAYPKNVPLIRETLRGVSGNYYFWSQIKHVHAISDIMVKNDMAALAAIHSYKNSHSS